MEKYSYSKINTFEMCPRQYFYVYIKEASVEQKFIEAETGSIVHEVIDDIYSYNLNQNDAKNLFRQLWQEKINDEIKVVHTDETFEQYYSLGETCLNNYIENYLKQDGAVTLFAEKTLRAVIGGVELTGRIDRISKEGESAKISDYKTGKNRSFSWQLPLYQYLYTQNYGNCPISLELIYLRNPYQVKKKKLTDDENRNIIARILEKVEKIENTEIFYQRKSPLCKWCAYREICQKGK